MTLFIHVEDNAYLCVLSEKFNLIYRFKTLIFPLNMYNCIIHSRINVVQIVSKLPVYLNKYGKYNKTKKDDITFYFLKERKFVIEAQTS